MTALALTAVLGTIAFPAGRSTIRRHQLNSAVQTLSSDLSRTRLKALETNGTALLQLDSWSSYRVAGRLTQLPANVHFSDASADSVVFDRFGLVADGQEHRLVLIGPDGAARELRIRPTGAVEARKL